MDIMRSYFYHTLLEEEIGVMPDPLVGELQKHLYNGEYLLFKQAPIFESDFIQITRTGQVVNIHHQVTIVTIGLTCTDPDLQLPDVMLLARPGERDGKSWSPAGHRVSSSFSSVAHLPPSEPSSWSATPSLARSESGTAPRPRGSNRSHQGLGLVQRPLPRGHLELTSLLPLKLVKISVHHKQKRRLRVNLASGRIFYLQLYVHPDCEQRVFDQWVKLVHLLQQAGDADFSEGTLPTDTEESPHSLTSGFEGHHQPRLRPRSRTSTLASEVHEMAMTDKGAQIKEFWGWKYDQERSRENAIPEKSVPETRSGTDISSVSVSCGGCLKRDKGRKPCTCGRRRRKSAHCCTAEACDSAANLPPDGSQRRGKSEGGEPGKRGGGQERGTPREGARKSQDKRGNRKLNDWIPSDVVSSEQRKAEILEWLKKAEEEERRNKDVPEMGNEGTD
ncbi:uncharacterized protein LOC121851310 isoform X2 [Callorhinchus milii]|uniref:uncharacterized protein LOC121851310 isoform X2 n=1 Tax=Callorhinchus milii TaxID=7868 RepID=UPI001C3FD1FA|nr:uncharacterized protein LOC121851310 isoform X2 [Callorhinchus milii]